MSILRPTHPGEILNEDVLPALGMDISAAAKAMRVHPADLSNVLSGAQRVDADWALRFGRFCGNGPSLWMDMQADVDLWDAEQHFGNVLEEIPSYAPPAEDAYDAPATLEVSQLGKAGPSEPPVDSGDLVKVLRSVGDFARAQAQEVEQAASGPDPSAAIRLSDLGSVQQLLGDLAVAQTMFERALQIDEKALGTEHPNVAIRLKNLAAVLQDRGNLDAAGTMLRRALKIAEVAFGSQDQRTAVYVNNLGTVLLDLRDLAGARTMFERALRINETSFGPKHPEAAISANNLATVLIDLGELNRARALLDRALQIDIAAFGPKHRNVAIRLSNLGAVLWKLDQQPQAVRLFRRALAISRVVFGEDDSRTQGMRQNLEAAAAKIRKPQA